MILADATSQLPPPSAYTSIGWFVVVMASLCMGAYYVLLLVDRIKGQPQRPPAKELQLAMRNVEARVNAAEGDIRRIKEDMKLESLRLDAAASKRSADLYAKIDAIRIEMNGNLEQTRTEMSRGFQDMERAIGRLEGKIQ